jgi:hypothetical protein
MIRLSGEQRRMLIDKLPDVAIVALGALWFGQFVSDRPFSSWLAVCGIAGALILFSWSFLLGRGDRR